MSVGLGIDPVLVAGPIYDRFRRGDARVAADGFELLRMQFDASASRATADETLWEENERFAYPLFVPGQGRAGFRELLVVLNGLNDSSYRKFFPWAASIARAGLPVAIFPSAFLLNRRPRSWISPTATERAWQARMLVAPESASLINAALSLRVAQQPASLLLDAVRTGQDVQQLAAALAAGQLGGDALFVPGARCHLLGYSLGGYIALALRLLGGPFEASKIVTLCAGASIEGTPQERIDPVSPFILDRHASELLLASVGSLRDRAAQLGPLAEILVELFSAASASTRKRIDELAADLTVFAGAGDRTVPAAGIAANLGRLDAVLPLGIHEYPFNLAACDAPDIPREIARSHRIAPAFEASFRDFLERVLQRLAAPRTQPALAQAQA